MRAVALPYCEPSSFNIPWSQEALMKPTCWHSPLFLDQVRCFSFFRICRCVQLLLPEEFKIYFANLPLPDCWGLGSHWIPLYGLSWKLGPVSGRTWILQGPAVIWYDVIARGKPHCREHSFTHPVALSPSWTTIYYTVARGKSLSPRRLPSFRLSDETPFVF